MNYSGAIRPPIQNASVCSQTGVSWDGAQHEDNTAQYPPPPKGRNVLLLLSIAGHFRPSHDQWELPLEWQT